MNIQQEINDRLEKELKPDVLELVDQSAAHRGHTEAPAGGQSHFHLTIQSNLLQEHGSILNKHKRIYDVIGKDMMGQIHALSIRVLPTT